MKFNVSGKSFQQQLQAVSKVINSKNAMSILENFLLTVEGDVLTITGSDQENVMSATVDIMESECDGKIVISAKTLLEITKEVSGQPLTVIVNDDTKEIDIRFMNGHFNFMGLDASEYPEADMNGEDGAQTFRIPASVVQKGIEKTIFAVSSEPIRPAMTGIFWDIHESDLTFVASDTHKLVRYVNSESAPGITASFIMPSKPAGILRGVISKEDADIDVTVGTRRAIFRFGTYRISCRYVNGTYPNYNRVIPSDNPYRLTVDRASLLNAMRRVSLFASKASGLVRFSISQSQISLSGQDMDYSTSAEEVVNCDFEGRPITIGFNAQYAIEVLSNLVGDTAVIELSDPARPGVFYPLEKTEGEDLVTIQMPMQVLE